LQTKVEQLQIQNPEADVEVWAMDEQTLEDSLPLRYRVGLKPVIRRIWVDEWKLPIAQVNWRFKWLWLYAFVHPRSGQTYWWILPYVNIRLFNKVLADFAQHFGIGDKKQVVLVVDQAGWHTSEQVEIPEGIHLEFLPSHSPELQPAERLWTLTNEPIANRSFESLDEVEEVLIKRCRQIIDQPDFVRGLTNFSWWSELAA
jgi:transposase